MGCCPTVTPEAKPVLIGSGAPSSAPDLSQNSPWYIDLASNQAYIFAAGAWALVQTPVHWMAAPAAP